MKHGKVDANQAEIKEALEKVGADVFITSDVAQGYPDLTVGFRGHTFLIEVKTTAGKLTEPQQHFHATWRGHVAIVRNVDEALRVIGAI